MNIRCLLLACAAALPLGVAAMDLRPTSYFVQGAIADNGGYSLTAGLLWPSSWQRQALGGEWSASGEAFVSHWSGRGIAGRSSFTQVGLVPLLRYRFSQGRSDWFAEGGIGISVMDRLYRTQDKQFSTRFNFVDVVGVGRSFGVQRSQELSLRITHYSNAGIKSPNPGEEFLQLRYTKKF